MIDGFINFAVANVTSNSNWIELQLWPNGIEIEQFFFVVRLNLMQQPVVLPLPPPLPPPPPLGSCPPLLLALFLRVVINSSFSSAVPQLVTLNSPFEKTKKKKKKKKKKKSGTKRTFRLRSNWIQLHSIWITISVILLLPDCSSDVINNQFTSWGMDWDDESRNGYAAWSETSSQKMSWFSFVT